MKTTDLRIGDRVQNKTSKFPMTVVAIFEDETVHLDFEGNEGDVWEENIEDLEFCEPRYKLPEWKKDEDYDAIVSSVSCLYLEIEYVLETYDGTTKVYFHRNVGDTINVKRIGDFSTLDEAKEAAEKHYNEVVSEIIEQLTSAHLTNEASKTQHND